MALNKEREEGTDFLTGIRPSAFGWRVNRTYLQKNKNKNKQCIHAIKYLFSEKTVRINLGMIRSLYESLNVGFPASSSTNEALWIDGRHRSPSVIVQTDSFCLMTQNRASSLLSVAARPLDVLSSTHAFRRPWSLFRLLLSRLEERENTSSHHTYQHQTRRQHRHHHHPLNDLTAISTLASSSCEAMKLS